MSDQTYVSDYVELFQSCTGLLLEYEGRVRLSTYALYIIMLSCLNLVSDFLLFSQFAAYCLSSIFSIVVSWYHGLQHALGQLLSPLSVGPQCYFFVFHCPFGFCR